MAILGTPDLNAALDAQAQVLQYLLTDMQEVRTELQSLTERLMRDYLILESLMINMYQRAL
jgi:hypothetical protein